MAFSVPPEKLGSPPLSPALLCGAPWLRAGSQGPAAVEGVLVLPQRSKGARSAHGREGAGAAGPTAGARGPTWP